MTKVIAIANQKGGVGKTSTTVNLGAGLVRQGYAVLAIDFDPQANLTMALGFKSPDDMEYTVSNVLAKAMDEEPIDPSEGIFTTAEGVDLMPSSIQLSRYELSLVNEMNRESMLRQFVDAAKPNYDYILIRNIFYQMNTYTLTTGGAYDEEEDMYVLTVYINQYCMDYREAADYFRLTDYQREILYEMMKPEYCEYYARLMGINISGGANVNEILSLLPSGTGGDVCRAAISKLGAPYVLGAKGDDKFDCSGLVCWAINQVDPDLGAHFWARAADQAYYCHIHDMEIEQSELQPGDLVFWQNRQCSGCGRWNEVHHTGIYIGLGMVIEASSSKGRVVIRDLWSTYNYPIYMFARPYS